MQSQQIQIFHHTYGEQLLFAMILFHYQELYFLDIQKYKISLTLLIGRIF